MRIKEYGPLLAFKRLHIYKIFVLFNISVLLFALQEMLISNVVKSTLENILSLLHKIREHNFFKSLSCRLHLFIFHNCLNVLWNFNCQFIVLSLLFPLVIVKLWYHCENLLEVAYVELLSHNLFYSILNVLKRSHCSSASEKIKCIIKSNKLVHDLLVGNR